MQCDVNDHLAAIVVNAANGWYACTQQILGIFGKDSIKDYAS